MQIEPSAGVFAANYARGATQVVWTTLVADLDTPVSAFLKTGAGRPLSFLLESVEGGAARGRYSIIGLNPDAVWRAHGGKSEINRAAGRDPEALDRAIAQFRKSPDLHWALSQPSLEDVFISLMGRAQDNFQ